MTNPSVNTTAAGKRRRIFLLALKSLVGILLSRVPSTNGFAFCNEARIAVPVIISSLSGLRTTTTTTTALFGTDGEQHPSNHRSNNRSSSSSNNNNNTITHNHSSESPPDCVLKERNPYDVHVYYDGPDQRAVAMELRRKLHDRFGGWMRFYPPKDRPIGPHPLPMWEADFGGYEHRHKWSGVAEFLREENRDRLSILIHPHSTDGDYADHTQHAFWAGPVLQLRIGGWRR